MLSDPQSPFSLFLITQLHLDINSHHLDIKSYCLIDINSHCLDIKSLLRYQLSLLGYQQYI